MPGRYPEINKLVDLLHARRISTFLVTNAQFPEAIDNLHPVCQLYVRAMVVFRAAPLVRFNAKVTVKKRRMLSPKTPHTRRFPTNLALPLKSGAALTIRSPVLPRIWGARAQVSVDASTKESLKRIDRPLFKDFWERFLACLKALSRKVSVWEGCDGVRRWRWEQHLAASTNPVVLVCGRDCVERSRRTHTCAF